MRLVRSTVRLGCLTAGVLVVSAATAAADSILITSGSLTIRPGEVTGARLITLAGEGFTFEGFGGSGLFGPAECQSFGCFPGGRVDLGARFSGLDLPGTAMLNGQTFTDVGAGSSDSSMFAEWTGALTIPVGFAGGLLTAPFEFQGSFAIIDPTTPLGVRNIGLGGSGTARLMFVPHEASNANPDFAGAFTVHTLSYDFEAAQAGPVPAPASMLLLGTGFAAAAADRRRRRDISR